MSSLDGLGLRTRWIYEVLLTTFVGGAPHAAPFGVWTDDGTTLQLDAYEGSRTLGAILGGGDFVANFPDGVTTLARAASGRGDLDFRQAERVAAPCLTTAAAVVELTLLHQAPGAGRTRITAAVAHVRMDAAPRLINRAKGLLLESLIMASRRRHHDTAVIAAALEENRRVVRKVAPGSSYALAMDALLRDAGIHS